MIKRNINIANYNERSCRNYTNVCMELLSTVGIIVRISTTLLRYHEHATRAVCTQFAAKSVIYNISVVMGF